MEKYGEKGGFCYLEPEIRNQMDAQHKRDAAAYRMLKILSTLESEHGDHARAYLKEYTRRNLGTLLDEAFIDLELERTPAEDLYVVFDEAADQFYIHSDRKQRKAFIIEALHLVRADNQLNDKENAMINRLFDAWLS